MKLINRKSLLISGLCTITLFLGTAAYAEKGAERLATFGKTSAPAPAQFAAPAHNCANCTDTFVNVVDKGTKGPNHLVTKVSRHSCAACDTKFATEGTGKSRKDVAIHSCNGEVKPMCCAMN
jgi:hypothetical protein